jgi:predicted Na+-dependent transporter
MRAALAQTASIAIVIFAVSSMLSIGLAYRIGLIVGPLREVRAVFRALVANFLLVPLLAVGIERVIPMDPPLALGLFLLAGSAGAPFLITLASAAKSDLALCAALLLLLVPATVFLSPLLRAVGYDSHFPAQPLVRSTLQHCHDWAAASLDVDSPHFARPDGEGTCPSLGRPAPPDRREGGDRCACGGGCLHLRR